jgi:hypothetical protein
MSLSHKIKDPSDVIIEKTAGEFAATFFEAARSSGMGIITLQGQKIDLRKYKNNPRDFARRHLEKFIPAAVHALTELLARDSTPADQKEIIYQALLERVNDPDIDMMAKTAGLPEYEQTSLYKSDQEKPKPVIINTPKIEDFKFDSTRKH